MSTKQETDVLIVGAGPVGLTLACELRRRGIACRLIDKYAEFPITSRALGLQARTLEVFDDMGVVDPVIAQGATVFGATFLQGERIVATVKLRLDRGVRPDQPYRGVVVLNQAKVEGVLRDRLATLGGAVERSRELVAFHEEDDAVVATINDPVPAQRKGSVLLTWWAATVRTASCARRSALPSPGAPTPSISCWVIWRWTATCRVTPP